MGFLLVWFCNLRIPHDSTSTKGYIARDQGYLTGENFSEMFSLAQICSKQLTRFIQYLETQPNARRVREDGAEYNVE
jgi:hypothetical protein